MNKNTALNLYIRGQPSRSLAERVSAFHAEVVESRLAASSLSEAEKAFVLDEISKLLKKQEASGLIQFL